MQKQGDKKIQIFLQERQVVVKMYSKSEKDRQGREGMEGGYQASCDCGPLNSVWMRSAGR